MPRVVVLGATGHIGNASVRALLARGVEVVAASRNPEVRALAGLEVERARVDLLDGDALARVTARADVVVFAAGAPIVGPLRRPEAERVHTAGVERAARAAVEVGARFVYTGSAVVFSAPKQGERSPLRGRGRTTYERCKLEAEHLLDELGPRDEVRLYPTGVIGPWDFAPSELGGALRGLWRGTLPAVVGGGYDWVDVRDVAESVVEAALRPAAQGRYLVGGEYLSAQALFAAAAELTGTWRRPALPLFVMRPLSRVMDLVQRATPLRTRFTHDAMLNMSDRPRYCCDRAREDLGYDPRDVRRETLPDLHAFFAEDGQVPA